MNDMINWVRKKIEQARTAPDSLLVEKAKQGDVRAFEQLYMKYVTPMYRYCYFHLNQSVMDAEDATSKIFFQAMKALPTFAMTNNGTIQAWFYAIARNVVTDIYRERKTIPLSEEIEDTKKTPEEAYVSGAELSSQIQSALNRIRPDQRDTIILRNIEGYSYKEIAALLHKNEDAVRAIQSRGLKELKKYLKHI